MGGAGNFPAYKGLHFWKVVVPDIANILPIASKFEFVLGKHEAMPVERRSFPVFTQFAAVQHFHGNELRPSHLCGQGTETWSQ